MGYRTVTGLDPLAAILAVVNDEKADKPRRLEQQQRIAVWKDDAEQQLRAEISRLFSPGRRNRLYPFARLAQAQGLFKRVVNDIARAAYGVAPNRRVLKQDVERDAAIPDSPDEPVKDDAVSASDQAAFDALAKACRLNPKMKLAARIVRAANAVFLHFRVSQRLGLICDVLAPHQVAVLPDPDDPTRALGIAYAIVVGQRDGSSKTFWVYWDDEEAFKFSEDGMLSMIEDAQGRRSPRLTVANGHPGILPFVDIHLTERFGTYWDVTEGRDLVAADRAKKMLLAQALRLIKTQGHQQYGIIGDIAAVQTDQLLDEEEPIKVATTGQQGIPTDIKVLSQPTDVSNHLKLDEYIGLSVAANHGFNRDQLNQNQTQATDQSGLLERRLEVIEVFAEAEPRVFAVMRDLSDQTEHKISADTELETDFPEVASRINRLIQLQIWEKEMTAGVRSYFDNVREERPEITSDEEADEFLQRTLKINLRWKTKFRDLNMPINPQANGQSPEANGAMGPAAKGDIETTEARNGDVLAAEQQKLV